jgi:hypothetical protein
MQESKLVAYISNWIGDYVKNQGLKALVVPYDDTYPSILATHLCVKARIKCNARVICACSDSAPKQLFPSVDVIYLHSGPQRAIAEPRDGLVVSDITRTESLARRYHKYNHAADIYPIYELFESQVESLVRSELPGVERRPCPERDELEWAILEDSRSGIIKSDVPPQQNKYWFAYTIDQKRIIAKAHDRQRKTLHKTLDDKMICRIPTLLLS